MFKSLSLVSSDSSHGQSKKPLLSSTLYSALAAVSFLPLLVLSVMYFQTLYFWSPYQHFCASPCQHFCAAASKLGLSWKISSVSLQFKGGYYNGVILLLQSTNHRSVPAQDLIESVERTVHAYANYGETGAEFYVHTMLKKYKGMLEFYQLRITKRQTL